MKFSGVDMQDPKSQSPLQVQSVSENGTTDRGIRRTRPADSTNNNNNVKAAPEVIDLDVEDSPKENEEVALPINGMTTVRKVSLPWQRNIKLNTVEKKACESSVESTSAECPTSERANIASKELSAPAEADEASSNQAIEGGCRLKKINANEHHKVVKKTSINKQDRKLVIEAKKNLVGTKSKTPSHHQGERKRPSVTGNEESDPKRPKIDSGANGKVASGKVLPRESESKESLKSGLRDPSEVSVVDLVEDDEEPEKVSQVREQEMSAASDGTVKMSSQTSSDNKSSAPPPNKSESVQLIEKMPLSAAPGTPAHGLISASSPNSVVLPSVPHEEKRTSLSSIISPGKNGLISQMQSIEVKKVKLCPELEKQATAMSALTSTVSTPKPSTGASKVQIPVSITASTPETTEIPSVVSSKAQESPKEVVKESEAILMGADLEKKKGLNPVHSETRKIVKKLTRSELESFFLELACELIISKSDAGRYRQLYEEMKESCENKANKIAQLNKQLVDLSAVVHKTINETKDRKDYIPMKITRSVGLQLEQNQILAAMKNKTREERGFVAPLTAINPIPNSSASFSDRIQSVKYGRSPSFSRTTPPSTPNGLISGAGVKDSTPSTPTPAKSPQRQLKALHPRVSQPTQNVGQPPSTMPTTTSQQSNSDATSKRLGFIDIADEKMINSGSQIGVRRHRSSAVIVATTSSGSVNSSAVLSTLGSNQIIAPALKVVPSSIAHPATISGNSYSQPGANTRVVTATTIPVASGTPISSPRLAYIIPPPTATPIAVQQRQLVITSTAQSQQIRGRSPLASMPAMLVRPNTTLVQVPSGSITTSTPALIRAVQPNAAQQIISTTKTTPPQATRILGMPNRPSPATTKHPAPLPAQPQPTVVNASLKPIPRRPVLKLSEVLNGIVLSWNMTTTTPHEEIASYQLYAYQEGANAPPSPLLWKKVGDVKALPLPMACTLTQFADGHTYHFAVRAVDVHGRVGEFSVPGTIELFS